MLLWACLFGAASEIPYVPTYEIGETAAFDVIAPIAFSIPNPEETRRLKELEAEQSPLVFRYAEDAAAEAELELAGALARHREWFVAFMEQSSGRSILDQTTVDHPSFARFVEWYQGREKQFPLTTSLARTWALGRSDELFVGSLLEKLQAAMSGFITDEPLDSGTSPKPFRIQPSGREFPWDELVSVDRAQSELEAKFAGSQEPWGKFVARFVRPNCFYDAAATRRHREHRLRKISIADHYQPGDLIVSSGELVDARMKRALDFLHGKRIEQDAQAASAQARRDKIQALWSLADRAVNASFSGIEKLVRSEYHPPIAIGVCLLLLLWLRQMRKKRLQTPPQNDSAKQPAYAVVVDRNRQETIFVPLSEIAPPTSDTGMTSFPAALEFPVLPETESWEEKVLAAEKRADELMHLVRSGLAPHLAKHLMSQFVRELLSQRNQLVQTHNLSATELTRLEVQFAAVQRELTDRLTGYELRNAELEKELAENRKENRELIRMMMDATRNQQEKVAVLE